jgi:hypothetical protein
LTIKLNGGLGSRLGKQVRKDVVRKLGRRGFGEAKTNEVAS